VTPRAALDRAAGRADVGGVTTVAVGEAKTHLSRPLRRVEQGEEVVIERDGRPVARPVRVERPRRESGHCAGRLHVPDDVDDPSPDHLLDLVGGRGGGPEDP